MPQASCKPAQRAGTQLDQHNRVSNLADAVAPFELRSESGVAAGFLTLREICVRIRRSKSWAYDNGIVPLIDDHGNAVVARKKPPFPWLQLPPPCITHGKRLWADADFIRWYSNIRARGERIPQISTVSGPDWMGVNA